MSFPQLETDISFVDFLVSEPYLMISHCAWLSRCISVLSPENTTMSSASILILNGESLWNHHCSSLNHYFSCLKTPFIILKSPFFLEHVKTMLKPLKLTQIFALVTFHLRCPVPGARGPRRCAPRRASAAAAPPARSTVRRRAARCGAWRWTSCCSQVHRGSHGGSTWEKPSNLMRKNPHRVDDRGMCLTWGCFYGWCWLVWKMIGLLKNVCVLDELVCCVLHCFEIVLTCCAVV